MLSSISETSEGTMAGVETSQNGLYGVLNDEQWEVELVRICILEHHFT